MFLIDLTFAFCLWDLSLSSESLEFFRPELMKVRYHLPSEDHVLSTPIRISVAGYQMCLRSESLSSDQVFRAVSSGFPPMEMELHERSHSGIHPRYFRVTSGWVHGEFQRVCVVHVSLKIG